MRVRPYMNKDFDSIAHWIADERSHALWCANLMPYPLDRESFNTFLLDEERLDNCPFVAVTDEGRVVGFFCLYIDMQRNEGLLKFVIVDNTARNKGFGSEMLKLAVKYALNVANLKAVHLNVFVQNPGARKCYRKAGFEEMDITPNVFTYDGEAWSRCNMIIRRNDAS